MHDSICSIPIISAVYMSGIFNIYKGIYKGLSTVHLIVIFYIYIMDKRNFHCFG